MSSEPQISPEKDMNNSPEIDVSAPVNSADGTPTESSATTTVTQTATKTETVPLHDRTVKEVFFLIRDFLSKYSWIALLAFSVILIGYYTVFPSRGYFHSDTTDTLMWAQASHDAGKLFNTDYNYACILPFGTSLIMQALIPIFGVTMTTHVLGMLIFFILFTASLIWMLRKMHWSWGWVSVAVFTELMICSGSEKLREIFWGHTIYYSLGTLFIFVGLALLFIILDALKTKDAPSGAEELKKANTRMIVCIVLLCVWFILTCMNQIISITIFALPVMGAVFCERWLDSNAKPFSKKNVQALVLFVIMGAGMVAGYLITNVLAKDIVAGYEGAYSNYSAIEKWVENLQTFPRAWFTLLGNTVHDGDKLMSVDSVKGLLIVIVGVILLALPVVALFFYNKIEDRKFRILLLTYIFMTMLIMMGYIMGKLSSANWRLSPIVAMSAVVSIAFLKWAVSQVNMRRVISLLAIPVMLVCCITAVNIVKMPADNTGDNILYTLANGLKEHGLTYGYATFWRANGVTVVSDSAVKVRSVNIDENNVWKYTYQSCNSWFDKQEGVDKYFLLMDAGERDTMVNSNNPLMSQKIEEFAIEGYIVWVFDHNIF